MEVKYFAKDKENGSSSANSYFAGGTSDSGGYYAQTAGTAEKATKLKDAHKIWGQRFDGTQDITGDLTISAGNLKAQNDASISGTLQVDTSAYIDNLYVTDLADFNNTSTHGNAQFDGNISAGGLSDFYGKVTVSAESRTYNILPQEDKTYNLGSGDLRWDGIYGNTGFFHNLTVTGQAHFFELIIDKIKSSGGAVVFSPADGFTIEKVEDSSYISDSEKLLTFTAVEDSSFSYSQGSFGNMIMYYSKDDGNTYTEFSYNDIIDLSTGDVVTIYGEGVEGAKTRTFDTDTLMEQGNFQFDIKGNVNISGNLKSLASKAMDKEFYRDYYLEHLFESNVGIKEAKITIPEGQSCQYMFANCTSLITAPEISENAEKCNSMFANCTSLTKVPSLVGSYSMFSMFENCSSLTSVSLIEYTGSYLNCNSMFKGCTSLVTAPQISINSTTSDFTFTFANMFEGCSSLINIPKLPSTNLTERCCYQMFKDCISLTYSPSLSALEVPQFAYQEMFANCSSLTSAPKLPGMSLGGYCYAGMFENCTSLVTAPSLPATNLAASCYEEMFSGCSSLTSAPKLPATVMFDFCYANMFENCTSLTSAPELNATIWQSGCYDSMFSGCSSLNYIKMMITSDDLFTYQQEEGSSTTNAVTDWVKGVSSSGTLVKNEAAEWTEVTATESNEYRGIPAGWTVTTATE